MSNKARQVSHMLCVHYTNTVRLSYMANDNKWFALRLADKQVSLTAWATLCQMQAKVIWLYVMYILWTYRSNQKCLPYFKAACNIMFSCHYLINTFERIYKMRGLRAWILVRKSWEENLSFLTLWLTRLFNQEVICNQVSVVHWRSFNF